MEPAEVETDWLVAADRWSGRPKLRLPGLWPSITVEPAHVETDWLVATDR